MWGGFVREYRCLTQSLMVSTDVNLHDWKLASKKQTQKTPENLFGACESQLEGFMRPTNTVLILSVAPMKSKKNDRCNGGADQPRYRSRDEDFVSGSTRQSATDTLAESAAVRRFCERCTDIQFLICAIITHDGLSGEHYCGVGCMLATPGRGLSRTRKSIRDDVLHQGLHHSPPCSDATYCKGRGLPDFLVSIRL